MAGKPLPANCARLLGHLRINCMPYEGGQKRSSSVFLLWSHAGEDLQASDLTGVQWSNGALGFEDFASSWMTPQIVDQHGRVDQCRHLL